MLQSCVQLQNAPLLYDTGVYCLRLQLMIIIDQSFGLQTVRNYFKNVQDSFLELKLMYLNYLFYSIIGQKPKVFQFAIIEEEDNQQIITSEIFWGAFLHKELLKLLINNQNKLLLNFVSIN